MNDGSGSVVFAQDDLQDDFSLLDVLDHVLNQGVILRGNLVISLAGVDLVYVGLDVILTSVETALQHMSPALPAVTLSAEKPPPKKSSAKT
jgi:gas vesicle structural protein